MRDQNKRDDLLVGPHMTVREAVQKYPGIEAVFDRHGLAGCGGPDGPQEPILFFARVHNVDPAGLLRELNEYAARRQSSAAVPVMEERPKPARQLYFVALIVSLGIALLGGFPLGIIAALGGGRDIGLGATWTPLVQAHGHLQLVGFAGLFVVGIAYHVLPRFKNTELRLRQLTLPSIALLALGVVLGAASQPWADGSVAGSLFVVSAAVELAGAMLFASVLAATLRGTQRKNYDRYLFAGAVWFVAASLAHLVVVVETVADGVAVISAGRNGPLLEMYLLGFIMMFVLGVSIRVLPHFLRLRPPSMRYFAPALALFNGALAVRIASGWTEAYADWSRPDWLAALTVYAMAAAVAVFIAALNVHLPAVRDESSGRPGPHERLIRFAYVWLVVAFAIEVWYATKGLGGGFRPDFLEAGATRHALALGFVTQMIFGVGSRALPVFAGKKLYSPRLVDATWVLINLAAVMRVGHAVFPWGSTTFRFDHIAVAGAAGTLALAIFAFNIMRTVRPPRRREPGPARKESTMQPQSRSERFHPSAGSVVADVLKNVPGSLELLISYGFKPLADPEMRARVTPHVTLGTACSMHGIDIQALIVDLERLSDADGTAELAPRQRVLNALRDCYDPEIPVNIVDLGLVYNVDADEDRASIDVTLTSPDCPVADQLIAEVTERVRALGFGSVDVRLVSKPAWDYSRMTPAARQALGW